MKTDVLIVYEKRTREIENACLLAAELMHRGYNVSIRNVLSLKRYFTKAKVVIAPHLYDNYQVAAITKNVWKKCNAVIDLQYEQVLNENSDDDIHNPTGEAKKAHHIAWGDMQEQRYLRHGIKEEYIHKTGHLAMDIMHSDFDDYFFTKVALGIKHNIDSSKEWILYISSFSYAKRTESEIVGFEKLKKDAREFSYISDKSYNLTKEWLCCAAKKNPQKIFIYRKHPAEKRDTEFERKCKEIGNIYCIDSFSSRQWVKVCDYLYTWMSTSIVDAYYAGKMCQIIRPIPIPRHLDSDIMTDSEYITSVEKFISSIDDMQCKVFPVSKENITRYYGNSEIPAYIQIADLCQLMITGKIKKEHFHYSKSFFNMNDSTNIVIAFKDILFATLFDICCTFDIRWIGKIAGKNTLEVYTNEGYMVNSEIKSYIKRFNNSMEKIWKRKVNQ